MIVAGDHTIGGERGLTFSCNVYDWNIFDSFNKKKSLMARINVCDISVYRSVANGMQCHMEVRSVMT